MKIMIIGATGRTGKELTNQALTANHEVLAYVRHPSYLTHQNGLSIVKGELDDVDALTNSTKQCNAVAVTLGSKVSDKNNKLMELAIPNIIKAMHLAHVNRIIVLSALGVGETYQNTRYPYRLGVKTFLSGNFKDHLRGESKLSNSGLNWTTIHPGPLSNGPGTISPIVKDDKTMYKMPRAPRTCRSDVAAVMLKNINNPKSYSKHLIMASVNKG